MTRDPGLWTACEKLVTGEVEKGYDFQAPAHLERYLAARDLQIDEDLYPVLESVQDDVAAAYFTGSVCAGFGNDTSDIDLYVFVGSAASQVPIPTFGSGFRVDLRHYNVLDADFTELAGNPPDLHHDAWRSRRRNQELLGRLVTGVPVGPPPGEDWARRIPTADEAQRLQLEWWSVEVARRFVIVGLTDHKEQPALARQRTIDLVLALAELLTTAMGELYFSVKWTGAKLERQGLTRARTEILRALAGASQDELVAEIRKAMEACDRLRSLKVGLRLPEELRVYDLGDEVLLEHLGRQGLLLTAEEYASFDREPSFGLFDCVLESLSPEWRSLFKRQLVWLSVWGPEETDGEGD